MVTRPAVDILDAVVQFNSDNCKRISQIMQLLDVYPSEHLIHSPQLTNESFLELVVIETIIWCYFNVVKCAIVSPQAVARHNFRKFTHPIVVWRVKPCWTIWTKVVVDIGGHWFGVPIILHTPWYSRCQMRWALSGTKGRCGKYSLIVSQLLAFIHPCNGKRGTWFHHCLCSMGNYLPA